MRHLKTTLSSHYFYQSKIYDFSIFYSIFDLKIRWLYRTAKAEWCKATTTNLTQPFTRYHKIKITTWGLHHKY